MQLVLALLSLAVAVSLFVGTLRLEDDLFR
jgi:hypothetical protein